MGFIRVIGVCELLGAAGLLLPGLLRISQGLTPLAAAVSGSSVGQFRTIRNEVKQ